MKSRVSPGNMLFQIVVADYSHSNNGHRRTHFTPGKGKYEVDDIPHRTIFRWAKSGRQAMRKVGRKFGSVLSCQKVDSHLRHLAKIESLNLEPVKIEVNMTVEDFTINRHGEVSAAIEFDGREIDIE